MVSALVPRSSGPGSSPSRANVLCSWARHSTLTVPLSTQEYKWVPANCWGNQTNCGKWPRWTRIPSRGVEIHVHVCPLCKGGGHSKKHTFFVNTNKNLVLV